MCICMGADSKAGVPRTVQSKSGSWRLFHLPELLSKQ